MRLLYIVMITLFFTATAFGGAKEHFINGREYYESGEYSAAIEEFDKAYTLDAKAAFLFNIAQCYEKLGKLRLSVDYFTRFLAEDTQKTETKAVKNKIANLEKRVRKTSIVVTATEAGAEIFVDDKKVGTTPHKGIIPVDNGMHLVRITKTGFDTFTMNVGVSTGYSVPVYAKLIASPIPPAPTTEPSPPPPSETETEAPPPTASSEPEPVDVLPPPDEPTEEEAALLTAPTEESRFPDIAPWIVAGSGAALTVAGFAVLGGIALAKNDENLAHVADGVGWPGVAIAAGGTIWGVVRILKKRNDETLTVTPPLPYLTPEGAGIATAFNF